MGTGTKGAKRTEKVERGMVRSELFNTYLPEKMGMNSTNSQVKPSRTSPLKDQNTKRSRMEPPSPPNKGNGGGFEQGDHSPLSIQFFEGTHGVKAYSDYMVDLTRHKPAKQNPDPISRRYSDAISNHAPESSVYPIEDRFDTHGQLHQVRNEYLERFKNHMLNAQKKGELSFGYKMPFTASDGKEYVFTFRFDNGVWKEVTGYPNDRRDC